MSPINNRPHPNLPPWPGEGALTSTQHKSHLGCNSTLGLGARLARALASEANIILMDKLTASLNFGNRLRVRDCINALKNNNVSVLFTTHQPDEAMQCATRT